MKTPEDRLYSKEHEWALVSGKTATVGITFHAQDALGDVVFVEMPKVGAEIKQMQEFGVVESVKTVSTLYSPLSGKVLEINAELAGKPELINQAPYDKGWIIKLEITDEAEKSNLLSAQGYDSFLEK